MKVVEVTASRDYEGTVWTQLFSTVDKAFKWLASANADTFAGVDDLSVAWVGVDTNDFTLVDQFQAQFDWQTENVTFTRWDKVKNKEVPFNLKG